MRKNTLILLLLFLSFCSAQEWTETGQTFMATVESGSMNSDIAYCGTYFNGISKSVDGGNTWNTLIGSARCDKIMVHPARNDIIYASITECDDSLYSDDGLIRSEDAGETWEYCIKAGVEKMFTGLTDFPGAPDTMFAWTGGVFGGELLRSFNGGTRWDTIDVSGVSTCKFLEFNQNNTIYAAFNNSNCLYKSNDCGDTWVQGSAWNDSHSARFLAVHPVINEKLYVLVQHYLLESLDGGTTWTCLDSSANEAHPLLYINPQQPDCMILNRGNDILFSENSGHSWHSIGYNLDSLSISMVQFSPQLNKIFCSVQESAGETYSLNYDDIDLSINWGKNPLSGFFLQQNYPNPFNPVTLIKYEIPQNSKVELIVYDISGKVVESLVNQNQSAGSYSVQWNGSNYSSGVYLYQIQAGDFQQFHKCLLIK